MMKNKKVNVSEEISRIHSWLMSWMDKDGGIHGPIIHKIGRVIRPYPHKVQFIRFDNIEDTTWTQAITLIGYIELYRKTKDKKILVLAKKIADRLLDLQQKNGCFAHAAFEHDSDPFRKTNKPIIHQAHPSISLLRLYEITKMKKYLKAIERNIDFIIKNYFDKKVGTFKSSPISKVHISNMVSVTIEALIRFYKINGDDALLNIARSSGDWLCKMFNGKFIPYGDFEDRIEPFVFYNGIVLQGLDDLYFETKEKKYFKLVKGIFSFLNQSYDKDTGFYFHRVEKDRVIKYPQYVAASGIILWNMLEASRICISFDPTQHVKALKSVVYPNGGLPSYIGYGKWQDYFPCPAWVSMAFLGLSTYANRLSIIKPKFKPFLKEWDNFSFLDESNKFTLFKGNKIIWRANKKEEIPEINNIKAFYQKNILFQRLIHSTLNLLRK